MAMLTCGTDRRISSSTDFTKFQRGCSTAQIIDIGIVGETDETILIDNLQGSGDALLPGIDFLANHLHAAHVSLQITVGSQFRILHQLWRRLEVDTLHAHLTINHLVTIVLYLPWLIILEVERERKGTEFIEGYIVT